MASMSGRVIIVTGAGGSIGRATAQILAKQGATVVVTDVNEGRGRETVELVAAEGGSADFVLCDISSEEAVGALVARVMDKFRRIDGAFNNAAIPTVGRPLHEVSLDEFRRCIDINLTGTFLCMKYEIAAMLKAGMRGSIVNNASCAGVVGVPLHSEYSAAKHAVVGLGKTAAIDYSKLGIRVNTILPGAVRTPMLMAVIEGNPAQEGYINGAHPIGRYAEPKEIGEAAAWLLSDAASFITGASIMVDGGYTAA